MPAIRRLVLAALPVLIAGCHRAEVTSYRIPAEKDPDLGLAAPMAQSAPDSGTGAPAAGPAMADTAVPVAEGPGLAWSAPADWQSRTPGPMRKATFIVPDSGGATAELSITAFPSDVGGELANVNRWRGQVQLPPVDVSGLDGAVTRWQQSGLTLTFVDCAGPSQGILGAIIPFNGGTWFFKLSGADAVLARQKSAFVAFLRTIHPAAP